MCAINKVKIAKGIVRAVRARGGRFLKFDERSGEYSEIGNSGKQGAVEKTSQALREKQTALRKQIHDYNETSRGGIPKTQFTDEEFYWYSLHVFASINGEPSSLDPPASVKEMVENSNLEANFGASPDREEIPPPVPIAPVSSRHAMILAMARDQFPCAEPGKSRKRRMPAGESSSGQTNKKRAKISVEPTRDDFLLRGRGSRSDHRPGNVHWQEDSHSDARKKSSQVLPQDGLPKGILKNGNHEKREETLKDDPIDDLKDIQVPLNDMLDDEYDAVNSILDLSGSNARLSFLSNEVKGDRTSSSIVADMDEPRTSLASLGSWNARLSDTSIVSIDSKILEGRDSEVSVDAPDLDVKDTKVDHLALIRAAMHQAASSEDFVRAGELQQELRQLEALAKGIKDAAAKEDYVLAGKLQARYRTLTNIRHPCGRGSEKMSAKLR